MDIDRYDNLFVTNEPFPSSVIRTDQILKIDAAGFQTLIDVPFAYNTGVAVKKWQ